MKEMIMKLRKSEKGFTLMELLIVVAIIAVLIAIAIPVFSAQLEKAREATDAANIRSAYAEVMVQYLDGTYADGIEVELTQTQDGWQNDSIAAGKIGSIDIEDDWAVAEGTVVVTVDDDGVPAINAGEADDDTDDEEA